MSTYDQDKMDPILVTYCYCCGGIGSLVNVSPHLPLSPSSDQRFPGDGEHHLRADDQPLDVG